MAIAPVPWILPSTLRPAISFYNAASASVGTVLPMYHGFFHQTLDWSGKRGHGVAYVVQAQLESNAV
jgi:hypothetical protein